MPPAPRASILIVDDEASIRESLRMVLEFEGYRIEEAGTGVEALRIVRDRPPDTVLLDIRMPEMDGLDGRSDPARGVRLPREAARFGATAPVGAQCRRGLAAAPRRRAARERGGGDLVAGRIVRGHAAAA